MVAEMNVNFSIGSHRFKGTMLVRGGDLKNNSVIADVARRGRGGQLLPVGYGKLAMMRLGDEKLTIPQRFELIKRRAVGIDSLINYPLPELSLLGERSLFRHEGKLFEAVLLMGNPEVMRIINGSVGLEKCSVNKHKAVVKVTFEAAKVLADKINEELGLGLKLPEESIAGALVEKELSLLRILDIGSIWTSTLNKSGDKPLLQFCGYPSTSMPYDPKETANNYLGIALVRQIEVNSA